MKKRPMNIRVINYPNGLCSIVLENAGLHEDILTKLKNIIKHFAVGTELYFGHYRVDGMNISKIELLQYSKEIPAFYKTHGEYYQIPRKENSTIPKHSCSDLTVCCVPNDGRIDEIINKIFHYYLETIFFCPQIDWNTFVQTYKNYMSNGVRDFVMNGYTDIMFAYVDSGDFSVSFNPKEHKPQAMREQIDHLLKTD